MDLAAIRHEARVPMCCMTDERTLQITLQTGREATAAELIYADPYDAGIAGGGESWQGRRVPLDPWLELERHRIWRVTVQPPYRRLRYVFCIKEGAECRYLYEDGLRRDLQLDERVQCFLMPWMNPADCIAPPDWVRRTVWYQIYPTASAGAAAGAAARCPGGTAP